jgi:hypothetical protein
MMQIQAISKHQMHLGADNDRKFQAGGIIFVLFGGRKNGSSNRSRF